MQESSFKVFSAPIPEKQYNTVWQKLPDIIFLRKDSTCGGGGTAHRALKKDSQSEIDV